MSKKKRNRSKLRYIPKGAVIHSDGSWFYLLTEEERNEFLEFMLGGMFARPIGFGEMVCHAD